MHIPDGLLPAPVTISGYALAGLITWYSLQQINRQPEPTKGIPKASLLTAAFFVASSIHIPIPPTSIHLILNGLLGTVLGYYAFPAILIGLLFQAVMIGHGGLSTLGLNAIITGVPALIAYHIFNLRWKFINKQANKQLTTGIFAFIAGASGVAVTISIFFGLVLYTIGFAMEAVTEEAGFFALAITHIPLIILEGFFTTLLVLFLQRVKPQLLENLGD